MLVSYILVTALSATYARTKNIQCGCVELIQADRLLMPALPLSYAVIVFLFIFFAFYDIALTPLTVSFPSEILPTKARSKGLGITYLAVYIALVFNTCEYTRELLVADAYPASDPDLNPIALEAISWK